jgi:Tfp pilus tip-associated adhesin PilY1
MVDIYAVPAKFIGTGAVAQINGSGNPYGADDNYLSIFTGSINVTTAGNYRFAVDGDDAVEVLIDGVVRVGRYGPHGRCNCTTYASAAFWLSAGNHTVEFRHEEAGGGDNYYLYWTGPDSGNNWQIVPQARYVNLTMATFTLLTDATPASSITDYDVKVLVGTSSLPEGNCKRYPNGTYKPTGILQKFGEPGKLNFGLMTGTYAKNTSGGVLRKAIGSFTDEIVANTGQFKHNTDPAFKGIVYTIDKFTITDFTYSNYTHGNCGWITTRPINEGECANWGNPIAEMMFEGMRYYAGQGSATAAFTYGTGDTIRDNVLGLPKATWDDPFVTNGACAKPFILAITDINPSYDSNQLPSVASAFSTGFAGTLSSNDPTPVALDVEAMGEAISTSEGITGDRYIGEMNTTVDNSCSPKDMTGNGFGRTRGLCPEEPTKQGSFYSASTAYFGRTHDISASTGAQNVLTYMVGLASPLPRIEIPVGNSVVTMVPFAKSVGGCLGVTPNPGSFQPTNTIVDFYVESLRPASGTFRINYEDVEQGADHDMDAIVVYYYQVIDNNDNPVVNPADGTRVRISLQSEYAAGCIIQHIGYIISGTTADGTYLDVRDSDTDAGSDVDYYLDTPPGVTPPATVAQWDDNVALPLISDRVFTPGPAAAATLIESPLWYAAKWGGFVDQNDNNLPDLQSEWDSDGDGVPDTYFYVVNPLKLEQQLTRTFSDILSRGVSHVAPVVSVDEANRTQSGDKLYMAFFRPMSDNYWQGNLKKYGLDWLTRTDCSRTVPEWTVTDANDLVAGFCDGIFKPSSQSFWSSEADGGLVDKGGAGGRLKARMPGADPRNPAAPYYNFRNIYTYKGALDGSMVAFLHANITNADLEVGNDLTRYRIINFMYGYTYDAVSSANPNPVSKREWLLGDIIHSEPKVIDYFDDSGTLSHRFIAVGANDGMLHVFTDVAATIGGVSYQAGDEIFAFIPRDLLRRLQEFSRPDTHFYTVDGSPALFRSNTTRTVSGTDYYVKTLVFGERAGGRSYWALDVTAPDPSTWTVKWHIEGGASGVTEFQELGYTWSKPFFTEMKIDSTTTKEVVIFAGGYDTIEDGFPEGFDDQNENGKRDTGELHGTTIGGTEGYDKWNPGKNAMGRGIFVLDLADGSILFKASYGDDDGDGNEAEDVTTGIDQKYAMMKWCFPADISIIPLSDSLIVMYAADIYGQLWRIRYDYFADLAHDYTSSASTKWTVKRIFAANPGSSLASGDAAAFTANSQSLVSTDAGRKMFYSPDVSLFGNDWTSKPVLYVGTGDRQHATYTMISNRMYFVTDAGTLADETDLLNLTCDELDDEATVDLDTKTALRNILLNGTNSVRGFYRVLDKQGDCTDDNLDHSGEAILSQPTLFFKNVYYTSYQPVFGDPCNPSGNAFIYALEYAFGTSAFNYELSNDTVESDIRTLKDTYRFISGSSIPSGVRVIMRDGHAAGLISAGGAVAGVGENGSTNIPGPPGGITPLLWETE